MDKSCAKPKNSNSSKIGCESVIGMLDIDCFECQVLVNSLHPHLKGLPCASISSNGISRPKLASVNYEARSFGVTRSHSVEEALELCPSIQLISLPRIAEKTDRSLLLKAVKDVRQSLDNFAQNNFSKNSYTISFSSGDEFYIDLTKQIDSEVDVGKRLDVGKSLLTKILEHVFAETGLTCSGGVSTSKFRAKMASEQNRPNGVGIIHPDQWEEFLGDKEIISVPGLKGKLGLKFVEKLGLRWMKEVNSVPESVLLDKGGLGGKELAVLRRIFAGDL